MSRRRLASFEEPVKRARKRLEEKGGKGGFIDLLWKGMLIAERKSAGKDLDSAYQQALDYFEGLWRSEIYPVTSSFPTSRRIRLHDLDTDTRTEFPLKDLYKHIKHFGFIARLYHAADNGAGPGKHKGRPERMGKLHDRLRSRRLRRDMSSN